MLRLVHPPTAAPEADETPIDIRPPIDHEQRIREQQDRENASRDALAAARPGWAKSLIVAELEHDECDSMTDYFATSTSRIVAVAWSGHTRDLFTELRKAAGTFPETAHLGPGCDRFTPRIVLADDVVTNGSAYWTGSPSHWHGDLCDEFTPPTFTTRAEADSFTRSKGEPEPMSFQTNDGPKLVRFVWHLDAKTVEHREKYSMGAGYYLKAGGRYRSGWRVRKVDPRWTSGVIEHERLTAPATMSAAPPDAKTTATGRASVSLNAEKNGVELRFPAKPEAAILDALKVAGWRWSRFSGCWYHRDEPDARSFAERLARQTRV